MTRLRVKAAQPSTLLALLDSVLACDDRTRRARSLMFSGTFCGVVLLAGIGITTMSFGTTGFVASGAVAAIASLLLRRRARVK
jgi:hypothetical protein